MLHEGMTLGIMYVGCFLNSSNNRLYWYPLACATNFTLILAYIITYRLCKLFLSPAAVLQFTESDYSSVENVGRIRPLLQLLTNIATDLTVVAVPVNYTFLNDSSSPILDAVPEVPNFDPRRPIIAASK